MTKGEGRNFAGPPRLRTHECAAGPMRRSGAMFSEEEFRQFIREAIADRLEHLRREYVHWLNELKKLDDLAVSPVDTPTRPLPHSAEEAAPAGNVVRLVPRS